MLLNSFKIIHKDKEIINCNFLNDIKKGTQMFKTIIIGENATGKSFLLRQICETFELMEQLSKGKKNYTLRYEYYELSYYIDGVLFEFSIYSDKESTLKKNGKIISIKEITLPSKVIATTYLVDDKFKFSYNRNKSLYHYAGVKTISNAIFVSTLEKQLLDYLINFIDKPQSNILLETLKYLGYKPNIYVSAELKEQDLLQLLEKRREKKLISKKVNKLDEGMLFDELNEFYNQTKIIDFEIDFNRVEEAKEILKKIDLLDDLSAVKHFNIFLIKEEDRVPFEYCSSGEKQILFTFLKIGEVLCDNAIIIIDEPENSLHVSWQQRYVADLKRIFSIFNYRIHFLISTHSAYMISSLDMEESSIVMTKKSNEKNVDRKYELIPFSTFAWSIENILYQVFQVETSRNLYIDADMQSIINHFSGIENLKISDADLIYAYKRLFAISNMTLSDPLIDFREKAVAMLEERYPGLAREVRSSV